jgi:hypothetical protein
MERSAGGTLKSRNVSYVVKVALLVLRNELTKTGHGRGALAPHALAPINRHMTTRKFRTHQPASQDEKVRLTDLIYQDRLEHAFAPEVRIQQASWFSIMTAIGGIHTRLAVAYLLNCSNARGRRSTGMPIAKLHKGVIW